jgi:hypothetical protein
MMNASYHLAMARLRAEQLEHAAARHRPHADGAQSAPRLPEPLTMRLAREEDTKRLTQTTGVARELLPLPPLLIGEVAGRPVAALSLRDGAVVAERFDGVRDVVSLLRLRAAQMRHLRS